MALSIILISLIAMILVFILSALPLYFSVKFLGGKITLLKTVMVTFISGIIVTAVKYQFKTFGSIIAFLILIWIYHEVFRLRWIKALLAWLLQFVFIALFYVLAMFVIALLLGVSILALLL